MGQVVARLEILGRRRRLGEHPAIEVRDSHAAEPVEAPSCGGRAAPAPNRCRPGGSDLARARRAARRPPAPASGRLLSGAEIDGRMLGDNRRSKISARLPSKSPRARRCGAAPLSQPRTAEEEQDRRAAVVALGFSLRASRRSRWVYAHSALATTRPPARSALLERHPGRRGRRRGIRAPVRPSARDTPSSRRAAPRLADLTVPPRVPDARARPRRKGS